MKLTQLRDITAIAEHGSLRAAARHLGLAQPALTRSVHDLEHELGAALFERRARGVVPTPVGAAFVARARAILADVERARSEVEEIGGAGTGNVVVGLSVAAHLALLPRAIRRFRTRYPTARLSLVEGFFPALEGELREGEMDFWVGPEPERAPSSDLVVERLLDNTRVVIGRAGHPLAGATSLAELTEAEWVTTSITHRAAEELGTLFATHGLPTPRLGMQTRSALSIFMAILCSDALGMLPVQVAEFATGTGLLVRVPVRETLPAPTIVMVRRAGLTLTPAAQWFCDCCMAAAQTAITVPKV